MRKMEIINLMNEYFVTVQQLHLLVMAIAYIV